MCVEGTCFCAAHRTASCRRIGPRALRWLRRWAVVSTLAEEGSPECLPFMLVPSDPSCAVHARDPHTVVAIFCRLTGCAFNRTCCCAAHRTASCRRIGPRTLRWLRRVVASLPLRRKAQSSFHTLLLRYFSPRGRLNRNA